VLEGAGQVYVWEVNEMTETQETSALPPSPEWQMVSDDGDAGDTMRLPIRGGWLYRYRLFGYQSAHNELGEYRDELKALGCALVFVPDK